MAALQQLQKEVHDAAFKYAKKISSYEKSDDGFDDGFDQTFSNGKYKGKTISEVVNCDISYIGWILNNNEIIANEDAGFLGRIKFLIKQKLKN